MSIFFLSIDEKLGIVYSCYVWIALDLFALVFNSLELVDPKIINKNILFRMKGLRNKETPSFNSYVYAYDTIWLVTHPLDGIFERRWCGIFLL